MINELSPQSKVWIYQSNRVLSDEEATQVQAHLDAFCQQWTSHNQQLKAAGKMLDRVFVVLMADETQAGASGCSIDKSVHFMKSLQQSMGIDLFDRMTFAFEGTDGIQLADRTTFETLYGQGDIANSTIVYDTLVKTKADFDTAFRKRLEDSWHQRFV